MLEKLRVGSKQGVTVSWLWWVVVAVLVGWAGVAVVLGVMIGKAIARADLEETSGFEVEAPRQSAGLRAA